MKALRPYLLLLLAVSCLKDEPFKQDYHGYRPALRLDGWFISDPQGENMDEDLVDRAYKLVYDDKRFTMARSLLIIRNGKLVAEAYPHDTSDIDRMANIQSMTKSFTSILTGMALQKKYLDSVGQELSGIYPEHFSSYPEKKTITLRHALTMTTGIDFENGDDTKDLYSTDKSSVEFVLSKEQEYAPGVVFRYHDGAPQLVSAAIQKRFGQPLSAFAQQYLFSPLDIRDWKWESAKDGLTFGAFSLFLKPRDLAKFGQLLLQKGRWNGLQLVDSLWIGEASQAHVNSNVLGSPYGYYFWIYPAYNAYAADGHGGQKLMVFPDKNLVIVYTAWGYTSGEFFDNFNEVADLIFKSCK